MRAMWKGSISFGLINIPINVYPASEERVLEFHLLHKKDLSPIRFARMCKADNQEVPYSDIVKGYEFEKDNYIVIDEEEFKNANVKKTSTIDVLYFTEVNEIDPIYYEKPYFLEPNKQSGKAYKLLWEALLKTKKIGIATYVFLNREHIGALFPLKGGLLLMQMRYHNELRSIASLEIPKETPSEKELKMAMALIEQRTEPFQPKRHHDTYTEDLLQLIQHKQKGKKVRRAPKAAPPSYKAQDLMGLLQESLKKSIAAAPSKRKKTSPLLPGPKRKAPRTTSKRARTH